MVRRRFLRETITEMETELGRNVSLPHCFGVDVNANASSIGALLENRE